MRTEYVQESQPGSTSLTGFIHSWGLDATLRGRPFYPDSGARLARGRVGLNPNLKSLLVVLLALWTLSCGSVGGPEMVEAGQQRLTALVQLNSGGGAVAPFEADSRATGGSTYTAGANVDTAGVADAAPASVYQTERYGNFSYQFSNLSVGSTYTVRLHFAEVFWGSAGQRVFHVDINGSRVLANFDIFATAGANKALVRDFSAVASASGQIVVTYTTVTDNAKSSAIQLLTAGSTNQAPTVATAASANPNPASGMTTGLSVFGADDGGEASLSYSWATTGTPPAAVTFSANGTNAAKSVTATFTASGTYNLQATIRDQAGLTTTSSVTIAVPSAAAPTANYRINSGGSALSPFEADRFYSGGTPYSSNASVSTSGVASPAPMAVYQTERYGNHSYTLPDLTPNASYTVRLHFAEIHWTEAGRRVFNVAINGTQVLTNFDIFAAYGANHAGVKVFTATAKANGQILIEFVTVTDNAKSSGIEVLSGAAAGGSPTVATQAAASPSPVADRTTTLSVLGSDDGGEAQLTYNWATIGTPPASVSFSVNGNNAAKRTTATFSRAGSYSLLATIRDASGNEATSNVTVVVNQTLQSLRVSPASVTVSPNGTAPFTASGVDQFGNSMPAPTTTWSVAGGGSINSSGVFTAGGSSGGPFTVTASAAGKTATASVTVSQSSSTPTPSETELVVSWASTRQTIEGFGAADPQFSDFAVNDGAFPDPVADLLFSPTSGIGLSLLRVGINPEGTNWAAWSNATKAVARGARVWATPWSAPASMKDNQSTVNGGHLLPGSYGAWSDMLVNFARLMKQNAGVDLYALSAQNEPDFTAYYESMLFTNSEMVNFVKVLGPKLGALNPRPKLIVGNYSNWDNLSPQVAAIEADPAALAQVDFYGSNQYYGTPDPESGVRPVWEMEWATFDGFDPSIGNALNMAKKVHEALTVANVAAWHYWWCRIYAPNGGGDNQGLLGAYDVPSKRLWALGNWSRFVRPGFVRMTTAGGPSGVYISAFRNPANGSFSVVAINDSGSAKTFGISLAGATPGSVVPWRTSAADDLTQLSPVAPSGARFSVTVPASSVTTFVGTGS